ncbi:MAG: hypothetical protein RBR71_02265 [Gudongella sp.]|nr:hypothetical protein [Gudongella sp.]
MVSLIRNGSRSLYITSKKINTLVDFLVTNLEAEEMDIQVIQDRSKEYQTVIFIANALANTSDENTPIRAFLILQEPICVLSKLVTNNANNMIETVQPSANFIIMRASGDLNRVLKEIQKDIGGELISYNQYISHDKSDSIIIGLTKKPLSKGIILNDFNDNFLLVKGEYGKIKSELRMQALSYLNIGIDNKDWNEIEIRIYDIYGAYKLHYDRMMEVFEDLDIGLVLGESWSKDYPKALLSVQVYRVRFFTFEEPAELKRILFGLEHLEDGTRIVDYDVYYENHKVSWNKNLLRKKKADRQDEAIIARNELFAKLSQDTLEEIEELEKEIVKTRY